MNAITEAKENPNYEAEWEVYSKLDTELRDIAEYVKANLLIYIPRKEANKLSVVVHRTYAIGSPDIPRHYIEEKKEDPDRAFCEGVLRAFKADMHAIVNMGISSIDSPEYVAATRRLKTMLYKQKKFLKRRDKQQVPISLLTPGTVVTFDGINRYGGDPLPQQLTVDTLAMNGPDSYVVRFKEQAQDPCYDNKLMPIGFNASYITGVVRHMPGQIVLDDRPIKTDYLFDSPGKSKYSAMYGEELIAWLIENQGLTVDHTESVICHKLYVAALDKGILRHVLDEYDYPHGVQANKKRLRRFVRQNFNRFKERLVARVAREEEESRRMYEADFAAEYDNNDFGE